jgi:hydrogenase-4 transcriptional activator
MTASSKNPQTDSEADIPRKLPARFNVVGVDDTQGKESGHLEAASNPTPVQQEVRRHDLTPAIVGADSGLQMVMEQVEMVTESDVPVLIFGETGTGKEVVAGCIHDRSPRKLQSFLRVNCGAIPPELVDSELFGHERGSFTGASDQRRGWFERADGGTLFLDECGELPLAAQVRLLRVLQDGSLMRVGGEDSLHVDVRIIAATHRDLQAMIANKSFRADLWYRLSVFPIRLPPLRERIGDIPALVAHFSAQAAARFRIAKCELSDAHLKLLVDHTWPGNIRELAATIERAALLGEGQLLDIPGALGTATVNRTPSPTEFESLRWASGESEIDATENNDIVSLDDAMRAHIEKALRSTHGRVDGPFGAAKMLRINSHTLRARMQKLGIDWKQFRQKD